MKLWTERFLTFYLDSYLCAFRVSEIKEINRPADGFQASHTFVQLRDETLPFFDLKRRLGLKSEAAADTRLIVFKGHEGLKATLVDSVYAVVDLHADQWETVSEDEGKTIAGDSLCSGITSWKGQSVLLLDPLKLTDKPKGQAIAS
jgi:chemotaxis signal transduction protein